MDAEEKLEIIHLKTILLQRTRLDINAPIQSIDLTSTGLEKPH